MINLSKRLNDLQYQLISDKLYKNKLKILINLDDNSKNLLKSIDVSQLDPKTVENVVFTMRNINELNICGLMKYKMIEHDENVLYQIMEENEHSLEEVNSAKYFDLSSALEVLIRILVVLKSLHENKTIHSDLKPSNIFLTNKDEVIISDYCNNLLYRDREEMIKRDGRDLCFISIDELTGKELDVSSDIWNFGLILYYIMSGKYPFLGSNMLKTIDNIRNINYNPPDCECSDEVKGLLSKMLVKEKKHRIGLDEIISELKSIEFDHNLFSETKVDSNSRILEKEISSNVISDDASSIVSYLSGRRIFSRDSVPVQYKSSESLCEYSDDSGLLNKPPPKDAFEIYIEIEKEEVQCSECKMHISKSQCLINRKSELKCRKCIERMDKTETIEMEFCYYDGYIISKKCKNCKKEYPLYHFIKRKEKNKEGYKKEDFEIVDTCAKCRYRKNKSSKKEKENIFDIPPYYYENIDRFEYLDDDEKKLEEYKKITNNCFICNEKKSVIEGISNGTDFYCNECIKEFPDMINFEQIRTKTTPCEGDVYCEYRLHHYVPSFYTYKTTKEGKNHCYFCKSRAVKHVGNKYDSISKNKVTDDLICTEDFDSVNFTASKNQLTLLKTEVSTSTPCPSDQVKSKLDFDVVDLTQPNVQLTHFITDEIPLDKIYPKKSIKVQCNLDRYSLSNLNNCKVDSDSEWARGNVCGNDANGDGNPSGKRKNSPSESCNKRVKKSEENNNNGDDGRDDDGKGENDDDDDDDDDDDPFYPPPFASPDDGSISLRCDKCGECCHNKRVFKICEDCYSNIRLYDNSKTNDKDLSLFEDESIKLNIPPPSDNPLNNAVDIYIELEKKVMQCSKCKMNMLLSQCFKKESKLICSKCIKRMSNEETDKIEFYSNNECNSFDNCRICKQKYPLYHFIKRIAHTVGFNRSDFEEVRICAKCRCIKNLSIIKNENILDIPPFHEKIDNLKYDNEIDKFIAYSEIKVTCSMCNKNEILVIDVLPYKNGFCCKSCFKNKNLDIKQFGKNRTNTTPCDGYSKCESRLNHYVPDYYFYKKTNEGYKKCKQCIYCRLKKLLYKQTNK